MKCGNHNFLEPSGSLQSCNRTALPYLVEECSWGKVLDSLIWSLFKICNHNDPRAMVRWSNAYFSCQKLLYCCLLYNKITAIFTCANTYHSYLSNYELSKFLTFSDWKFICKILFQFKIVYSVQSFNKFSDLKFICKILFQFKIVYSVQSFNKFSDLKFICKILFQFKIVYSLQSFNKFSDLKFICKILFQ